MENKMATFDRMRVGIIAFSMILAGQVEAQDDVEITTQKLSETLYVLFGDDGNVGVSAGPGGLFIIDDQSAKFSDQIRATIAAISDQPISYVINTHWHLDHAGGNSHFSKLGSVIIAHDNARIRLKSGGYIETHDLHVAPDPSYALPVITFNDTMSLHLNGEETLIVHLAPAHTDGDVFVWFKDSNVIHAGDVFLNGVYPLIDYSSGGTLEGSIAAADTLLALIDDQTRIIPGHGPVSNKADIQAFRDMCVALGERVAAMKKRGMSLEEVIRAAPTADFDGRWNTWGDDWRAISLSSIYGALP
jgi:cyclase